MGMILWLFAIFLIGVPICFSLGFVSLGGVLLNGFPPLVVVQRMFTGADSIALIAIPLFMLAGELMFQGGMSKRMVDFADTLLGHFPSGLAMVNILACMFFGTLNGFLVAKYDMHPFIATLAVQVIVYGATSLYFDMPPNNSQPLGGIRPDFSALGLTKLFEFKNAAGQVVFPGISILVPIALVVLVVIWFVLNKTVFGKNVYAIGGNREAAVVSGVNVFKTIMGIFILASALYGVGGVLEAARTAGATNNYGNGYELDAIAACVVGGVSLNGGIGKVGGIVSGVLIFSVIQYGLQFINISPMWQQVIKGIIIAVAVAIDMGKYRKK